ncbi:hypothetical protein HGRIS_010550 [Hohenbuehelia grisea]|uniref:Protein CPL1-like domain-containing protein n=1 Tax=Hohenbuehelia grisea TaxID=104357 RepID=A0ABR3IX72_9AGAR
MRCSISIALMTVISSSMNGVYALDQLLGRALVDICAEVNAPLSIKLPLLPPVVYGNIDACLCLSTLPSFLQANVVTRLAINAVGLSVVTSAVQALINTSPSKQQCTYPDHSLGQCIEGNPCSFTCTDGYTAMPPGNFPTSCDCQGTIQPNGQCLQAPCPSGVCERAIRRRRTTLCRKGFSPCGTLGRGAKAYDCVDTQNDLESCGGCTVPFSDDEATGVDCSAIPGIADVACIKGGCAVSRCMPGFSVSHDRKSCVRSKPRLSSQR